MILSESMRVGRRLALLAFDKVYGIDTVSSGPSYTDMKIEQNRVRIYFDNVKTGLKTYDGKLPKEFAIAGEDKKFVWANVIIEGNSVVLWN
ncbi:MAG: sialate O-acetylesterase, partial [Pseudomonadota bacterium]